MAPPDSEALLPSNLITILGVISSYKAGDMHCKWCVVAWQQVCIVSGAWLHKSHALAGLESMDVPNTCRP